MKDVKESRFGKKKPEKIRFSSDTPGSTDPPGDDKRPDVRSSGHKAAPQSEAPIESTRHIIRIPQQRRMIRHAFNIFDDHLMALKTIQRAETDLDPNHKEPKLGELVQDALDAFITQKSTSLRNVELVRESVS